MAQDPIPAARPLGPSLARHWFVFGLNQIETAYRKSTEPLEDIKRNADAIVRASFGMEADERPPEAVADQGESPSFNFDEEVYSTIYEAEAVASLLRDVFLIALFHFWERQSNLWIGVRGAPYEHWRVIAWLRTNGYTPDEAAIEKLRLAANCAKHGPGDSCDKLYALDRSFFAPPTVPSMGSSRSHLQMTATLMDEMFAAARKSGPKVDA